MTVFAWRVHAAALLLLLGTACTPQLAAQRASQSAPQPPAANVGVGPQYDSAHVYVAPADADAFARSFLATFGGTSTKQVTVTVTPTPSRTTSQLLQTPSGIVSLFGFLTPIPFGFGDERHGYLVTDLDAALAAAHKAGAEVVVAPFPDAIGRDAIVAWPGGVKLQLYWHTTPPHYPALAHVPENRVYLSPDRANAFVLSFLAFSQGRIVSEDPNARGEEIGLPHTTLRRVRIDSVFGRMVIFVTDGHLVYPWGRETTGFEVDDLEATLARATASGATILVQPLTLADRRSAMVQFPGGWVAEIHSAAR